eukprot:1337747-Amphidinium_carterae.1
MPGYLRTTASRGIRDVACHPPHELIANEMNASNVSALSHWSPPPSWETHPVVQRERMGGNRHVVPLALYGDGVQFQKRDSLLVFTLVNLATGKKHTIVGLRKRYMCGTKCKCNCSCWCSVHPVLSFLQWSIAALAQGRMPSLRHDNRAWLESDAGRQSLEGRPMDFVGAFLQIRCDWAELCTTMGLVSWSSSRFPCFFCKCKREGLQQDLETADSHEERTFSEYKSACDACEIVLSDLLDEDWLALKTKLASDLRKNGNRGRCLTTDYPKLGLRKGDRLEPSIACADWSVFEGNTKPAGAVFWRVANETCTKHRNPLFDESLYTTVQQSATVDILHCMALGTFQVLVSECLWCALDNNVFAVAASGEHVRRVQGLSQVMAQLQAWYKVFPAKHAGDVLTKIGDLSIEMLGSKEQPKLKLKGHETVCMLMFLEDTVGTWESLPHKHLWQKAMTLQCRMYKNVSKKTNPVSEEVIEADGMR